MHLSTHSLRFSYSFHIGEPLRDCNSGHDAASGDGRKPERSPTIAAVENCLRIGLPGWLDRVALRLGDATNRPGVQVKHGEIPITANHAAKS